MKQSICKNCSISFEAKNRRKSCSAECASQLSIKSAIKRHNKFTAEWLIKKRCIICKEMFPCHRYLTRQKCCTRICFIKFMLIQKKKKHYERIKDSSGQIPTKTVSS